MIRNICKDCNKPYDIINGCPCPEKALNNRAKIAEGQIRVAKTTYNDISRRRIKDWYARGADYCAGLVEMNKEINGELDYDIYCCMIKDYLTECPEDIKEWLYPLLVKEHDEDIYGLDPTIKICADYRCVECFEEEDTENFETELFCKTCKEQNTGILLFKE